MTLVKWKEQLGFILLLTELYSLICSFSHVIHPMRTVLEQFPAAEVVEDAGDEKRNNMKSVLQELVVW